VNFAVGLRWLLLTQVNGFLCDLEIGVAGLVVARSVGARISEAS
jgi:hypothetical protein